MNKSIPQRLQDMANRKAELVEQWREINSRKENAHLEYRRRELECDRIRHRINDLEMEMERMAGDTYDIPDPHRCAGEVPGQTFLIPECVSFPLTNQGENNENTEQSR